MITLDKATPDLWAALQKAQAEFKSVLKAETAEVTTRKGGRFSYTYASLDSALEMMRPILAKHSLGIVQAPALIDPQHLEIDTVLFHATGAYIQASFVLPVEQSDTMNPVQVIGSVITYGRRYSVMALLNVATEDDDTAGVGTSTGPGEPPEVTPNNDLDALHALAADAVFDEKEREQLSSLIARIRPGDAESYKNMRRVWEMRRNEKAKKIAGEPPKDIF